MEPFFSVARRSRASWQGHKTKANVRNVIACARRDSREIRLFASQTVLGLPAFLEVPAESWDEYFAESNTASLVDLIIEATARAAATGEN